MPIKPKITGDSTVLTVSSSEKKSPNVFEQMSIQASRENEIDKNILSKSSKSSYRPIEENIVANSENEFQININDIEFHPSNSETYGKSIRQDLIDSIIDHDVLDSIIVCKGTNKPYRVLSGNTRVKILLDSDVQDQIKNIHGDYRYMIKAKNLGIIDEDRQKRLLLEYNLYRNKTLFQKFKESELEKAIIKDESKIRARLGKASQDSIGRIDDYLAKKYFGAAGDYLAQLRKVVNILSEDNTISIDNNPTIQKLNTGELKVKVVLEKLLSSKPVDKKNERITKGVTDADMESFIPKFKSSGYKIDDLSRKEMPLAYKHLINLAKQIKDSYEATED